MRKILVSLIALGLLGSGLAYLSGCAKQAGPLSPSITTLGVGNNANRTLPQVASTTATSVSATVQVVFNAPMDASSFVQGSTVLLYTSDDTNTTSETQYTGYSIQYNVDAKTLNLIPDNNTWTTDKRYHLVLTTGIRSVFGNPLDGNTNKIAEGDEFDRVQNTFFFGSPTNAAYKLDALTASGNLNDGSSHAISLTSPPLIGGLNTSYRYITLTVQFSETMDVNPSDSYTIFADSVTLPSFLSITDDNGAPVTPVNVTVTSSGSTWGVDTNNQLQIVLNLTPGTKYRGIFRTGTSGPRSSGNPGFALNRGRYIDLNTKPGAEADEKVPTLIFQTRPIDGNPQPYVRVLPPVDVTGVADGAEKRNIQIVFSIPATINGFLDPATINADNFKLFYNKQAIVLTGIELDNTSVLGTPRVNLYVPRHYANTTAGLKTNLTLFVSRNVKTVDGYKLDQDGNQVTGQPGDDYTPTVSVYNY